MKVQPDSFDFTLEPADNERLANLCGQFDEHLRQVEGRLGVEVTNRGNHFRVIGDVAPVQLAGKVLKNLYSKTAKIHLTPSQVHLVLQQAGAEALSSLDEVANEPLAIQTRRGLICNTSSRTISISALDRPVPARPIWPLPAPFRPWNRRRLGGWC